MPGRTAEIGDTADSSGCNGLPHVTLAMASRKIPGGNGKCQQIARAIKRHDRLHRGPSDGRHGSQLRSGRLADQHNPIPIDMEFRRVVSHKRNCTFNILYAVADLQSVNHRSTERSLPRYLILNQANPAPESGLKSGFRSDRRLPATHSPP